MFAATHNFAILPNNLTIGSVTQILVIMMHHPHKRLSEKERADAKLVGFKRPGSRGENFLQTLFHCPPGELVSKDIRTLGIFCAGLINKKLPRICRRRKDGLIKWFDDNYDKLEEYLPQLQLDIGPVSLLGTTQHEKDE